MISHISPFIIRPMTWATIVALFGSTMIPAQPAHAIDTSRSNFTAGGYYNALISDYDFADINSMSAADIQSFLESKNSHLKGWSENGRSAAQIIYDAAHGYDAASGTFNGIVINTSTGTISPRAILITLQKEQSLITMTSADRDRNVDGYNRRLERAMGYACPDGGSCDSRYLGFTKQVENAAWQFRYNFEAAGQSRSWWDQYYPTSSTICERQYYVNKTCSFSDPTGSYSVTLSNKATASLYRYTPHVFNGNYNFWYYFNTWFTASSPASPTSITYSNDTSGVSSNTYKNRYKIEGTKETDARVWFNGHQIAGPGSNRWSLEFEPNVASMKYTIEYRNEAGTVTGTKELSIDRHNEADINGDSKVDIRDLSVLGEAFGQGVPDDDWRNLNPETDSELNILDLSILADKWTG